MKHVKKIKKYFRRKLICFNTPENDDAQLDGVQITQSQPKPTHLGDFPSHGLVKKYRSQLLFNTNDFATATSSKNSSNERNLHKSLTRHSISSFDKRNLSIDPISTCSSLSANRTSISGPQTCNTWETSNGTIIKHVNSLMILHKKQETHKTETTVTKLVKSQTNSFENTVYKRRITRRNTTVTREITIKGSGI